MKEALTIQEMLKDYEIWVLERCYYPRKNGKFYCATALAGEVGEICNEVKKEYRDGKEIEEIIMDEAGDVLFYLIALCHEYHCSLEDVMNHNIQKLTKREEERNANV